MREREGDNIGCCEGHCLYYCGRVGGFRNCTAAKFPQQYPLVLLVEASMMGSGQLAVSSGGTKYRIWAEFWFGGLYCDNAWRAVL